MGPLCISTEFKNKCFTHGRLNQKHGKQYDSDGKSKVKNRIYFKEIEMDIFNDQQCLKISELNIIKPLKEVICSMQNHEMPEIEHTGTYSLEVTPNNFY